MLRVMAFACQFTVAHTLGHNCSYSRVGGERVYAKGLGGGTGDPLQPSPGIEADSRTQPSSEEREILSVVQGRMGCE